MADEKDRGRGRSDLSGLGADVPSGHAPPASVPAAAGGQNVFTLEQNTPCVSCGYNLRGLMSDRVCPECATPITISLPGQPAFVKKPEVDTPLQHSVPCVQCGTILQMQTTHGSCPTCLSPVWHSIHGTWLRASDPKWLGKIRTGVTLWLVMMVGSIILALLGGIAGAVWAITAGMAGPQDTAALTLAATYGGGVVGAIGGVLNLFVAWYVTTPNPATAKLQEPSKLRPAIHGGFSLAAIGSVGFALVQALDLPPWVLAMPTVTGLFGLLANLGLLHYLRGFACRIPSPKLARWATIVMWGVGLTGFVVQLFGVASIAFPGVSASGTTGVPAAPQIAFSCVMGLCGIVSLVFVIWLIFLVSRMRTALSRAIDQVTADRAAEGTTRSNRSAFDGA